MRTQLTSHKQNRNANTSQKSRIMHKREGGKKSSSNSSPTFISSDSEGCIIPCSMATVSRKSSPEEAGSETFNQSGSLARQNVLSLASFAASLGSEGKGNDVGKHSEKLSEEKGI